MPGFMLNNRQVHVVLHLAGIGVPQDGSQLRIMPSAEPLMPDDPTFQHLIEQKIIEPRGNGYRVNRMFAMALKTCASPEEVISIGIDSKIHPGFAVVRRGQLWCECSVNKDGMVKVYFPLSRSTVLMMLVDALSGISEDEPSGFHFKGEAADAFTLVVAMRNLREYPIELKIENLQKAVARHALEPSHAAPFTAVTGTEPFEKLANDSKAVDIAIKNLVDNGHLIVSGDRIMPSEITAAVLSKSPEAGFSISKTLITESGPKKQTMLVIKAGNKKLIFRITFSDNGKPQYEWLEVNRKQLRLLVTAMLIPRKVVQEINVAFKEKIAMNKPPSTEISPTLQFCTNCGVKLRGGIRFCNNCGAETKGRVAE